MRNKWTLEAVASGGYQYPGGSSRATKMWNASANHVDVDTILPLSQIRAGSRDLFMNSPLAASLIRRFKTNVIGFGMMHRASVMADVLGLSPEAAEKWNRDTERRFAVWSKAENCDARGTHSFEEQQAIAFCSELMNGDVFVLLPMIKERGKDSNLRIKLIEADYIRNPPTIPDSYKTAGGIEIDDNGKPLSYWLRKDTPANLLFGLNMQFGESLSNYTNISAFGEASGRRNILHVFEAERPGQRRGVPMLAPVMELIKQMKRAGDAEVMATVINSMFTVFIKSVPGGQLGPGFRPGEIMDPVAGTPANAEVPLTKNEYPMGHGSTVGLAENEEIQLADPKRPNKNFAGFVRHMAIELGAACQLPADLLLMEFNSSYSASRAALLEAWKGFMTHRSRYVRKFNQPIYEEWLTEMIYNGVIEAPGYFEDQVKRMAWSNSIWMGPGQGQINPDVETKAALSLISGGLSTHEREHAKLFGTPWEDDFQQLVREKKMLDAAGFIDPNAPKPVAADNKETDGKSTGE